jgi:hypothetical protein
MTRAAMLAALIVGIAMQAAAAEPFYREDVRIPMQAAGPRADNDVCDEDALLRAFATLGKTSIARQGARGICRLSFRQPAPGFCGFAKGSFRFPRRAPLGA